MQDLNDLAFFVAVADHRGFAPAARALGVQKSRLSRRIALLEERLGVRLIQRTSRAFAVTEVGQAYYQHCLAMLVEAEAAQGVIETMRAQPMGSIRLACPPGLLAYRMGASIAGFLKAWPRVRIQLRALNREVDVIGEGFDLVIRAGAPQASSQSLVARKLGEVSQCLVAAPALLAAHEKPTAPPGLARLPGIGFGLALEDMPGHRHEWVLDHPGGGTAVVPFSPCLVTDDLPSLRHAALAGVGVALMPNLMIAADLASGDLIDVLGDWRPKNIEVHAVFPTRRGLLPAIRALIDHLAEECQPFRQGTPAG